jgi:NAD(P)-dependent dehydrogenase (short-subunit alcohol dehydrogenase family)
VTRTVVVTGAASGIGKATAVLVERRGWRAIRADRAEGDVCAGLATPDGRATLVERVTALADGHLDAVIACAGLAVARPITLQVNYFGMVATLAGLRPLLGKGAEPRAVAVSSVALLVPPDPAIVDACLRGDEAGAVAAAEGKGNLIYASSKRALARWIRRNAITAEWAGAHILLNAIASGLVATPMTQAICDDPVRRRALNRELPMPIGREAQPEEIAGLLAWLASPANSMIVGQVIFVDGGAEATGRGDYIW